MSYLSSLMIIRF